MPERRYTPLAGDRTQAASPSFLSRLTRPFNGHLAAGTGIAVASIPSLIGAVGRTGATGPQGPAGDKGDPGQQGQTGPA